MGLISPLFEEMKPALSYTDVGIERDHVVAHMCSGAGATTDCFVLRLEYPGADCPQTHWGQFCVRFPQGQPSPATVALIQRVLRKHSNENVWTELGAPIPVAPPIVGPIITSAALVLCPLAAGWLVGALWRRLRRDRTSGSVFAIAALGTPAALMVIFDTRTLLVGVWDAAFIGVLSGAGLLLALHQTSTDRSGVVLMLGSCVVGLGLLEMAARLFLPAPPAFPSAAGPRLFISDSIEVARSTGFAPTLIGTETCRAIYEHGKPVNVVPDPNARERILHLGDSMLVAGGRFTEDLERLEPGIQHVNAAIAGTAPDVYLTLMRLLLARMDFTAVVMHLTPNDWAGIDDREYPCTGGEPLLVYGPTGTRLRFATGSDAGQRTQLRWLVQNSPPPYILRACVRFSSFAAHLAAAFVQLARRLGYTPIDEGDAVREANVTAILRDARDELAARHIPLVVDSFRSRQAVESGIPTVNADEDRMKQLAQDLGIVTIDTWQLLRGAVQSGSQPFLNDGGPTDPHFNAVGHALIAQWLHDVLPGAIAQARRRAYFGDSRSSTSP